MNLHQIDRVKDISKEMFINQYFKPQKPVVFERWIDDWPAFSKWNLDYIQQVAGDKTVPLYDDRPVHHKDGFNEPHTTMNLGEYVDVLKTQPTRYRIFLWNIFKEVPQLQQDFWYPKLGLLFLKTLPMLFFGGRGSYTFMHYDIDLANIFHFHFEGKKKCILFDQQQTKHLYKVPHSLITREDIDFEHPDYDTWPNLKKAEGYVTTLEHGNVLYMPEGYWHYMQYKTPGFSMSLRTLAYKPKHFAKAVYNVTIMRNLDNLMRRLQGQQWIEWKNRQALKN